MRAAQPLAGALVAGGLALVETDGNGFFRMRACPPGGARSRRAIRSRAAAGRARVTVLPGQTVSAAITLEARATITGRVLDANGAPVPRATRADPGARRLHVRLRQQQRRVHVPRHAARRLPDSGARTVARVADRVHGGERQRPAQRLHVGRRSRGAGRPAPPSFGSANAVLAAYQKAVRTFLSVDESLLRPADGRPRRVRLEQGAAVPGLDDRASPTSGSCRRARSPDGPSTATDGRSAR